MAGDQSTQEFIIAAEAVRLRVYEALAEQIGPTIDGVGRDSGQVMMAMLAGAVGACCDLMVSFDLKEPHASLVADWMAQTVRKKLPAMRRQRALMDNDCAGSA